MKNNYAIDILESIVNDEVIKEQVIRKIKIIYNTRISQAYLTDLLYEIITEETI